MNDIIQGRKKKMTRPRKLTLVLLAAITVAVTPLFARMEEPSYPQVVDDSHATPEASQFFGSFFAAKSKHDVAATMKHFSPELATYTDATLGWPLEGFDAVEAIFNQYMPKWPASGLSYPTRILGDTQRAGRIHRYTRALRRGAADSRRGRFQGRKDCSLGRLLGQLALRQRSLSEDPYTEGQLPDRLQGRGHWSELVAGHPRGCQESAACAGSGR